MKHFLLILSLLLLPFMLFASNDDLSKSKGTTQDVIVQLTPSSTQEDVSRNVKIEVTFNVSLDASAIKEYDVKLTYLSSKTNDHIAGTISYGETDKKLTFTPKASLEPGMYEVEIESLKANKAHKEIKVDEIMYRFVVVNEVLQSITINPNSIELKETESIQLEVTGHYDTGAEKNITTQVQWNVADSQIVTVDANATLKALKEGTTSVTAKMESIEASAETTVYWEVNGHRLPPEPNKSVNDSTLLGVDVNENGVRDDVERWIYETYKDKHPIHIDIAMQAGRAYKLVLETPEQAKEIHDEVRKPLHCQFYYESDAKYLNKSILVTEDIVSEYFRSKIYYNTKERMDAYIQYDTLLSGDSYTLPTFEEEKKSCNFNTSKYEE